MFQYQRWSSSIFNFEKKKKKKKKRLFGNISVCLFIDGEILEFLISK